MVDINLMGDEENREERQPEESFAQTVNLDLGETADDEQATPFVSEAPPQNSYSREPMAAGSGYGGGYATRPLSMNANNTGSSRNKAYLLVAALILAALVAVYLMIPKSKNTTVPTEPEPAAPDTSLANNPAPIDTTSPIINQSNPETATFDPLFASTRIGAYTVGALGQSFSGGNDFSLISYSGNNNSFIVQFMAPSAEAITEATQAMQRSASPQEMRTVSKMPAEDGSAANNVLVLGRVSERAATMGPAGQRRMSFTEFSAWLKKLGADNGLQSTLFEVGQAYASDGTTRTPVQANFSGNKAGAFDFLRSLADAGPNVSMSKIIVSSADRKSLSSAKLDVVLLFDFIE